MNRRDFIKLCSVLGISIPFQPFINGWNIGGKSTRFSGSVIIIGAGAGGMASGYLLAQQGIDFQILEASPTYGGRMKRTTTFADFPIPLGGEWLHVADTELPDIVNDSDIEITTQIRRYSEADTYGYFQGGELYTGPLEDYTDGKFVNSTWFDFFDEYVVPSIRARMTFDTQIVAIDYSGNRARLTDSNGLTHEADKVIVSVPLKILQDGDIQFIPPLPDNKTEAIAEANIWSGFKAFIEFTEKFYPTFLDFPDSYTNGGQRTYYDATVAQDTTTNILGLFAIGAQAERYQALSGDAQRDLMLRELDEVFDSVPSQTYVKHIVQNWNEEPFIRAAYLEDDAPSYISRVLSESIDQKLFFAGTSYTQEDDWSSVHTAAHSARDAVTELLQTESSTRTFLPLILG
ncbi:MAG: FAD-dependent oxidoreductase [Chloroflexota bacterium]